MCDIITIFAADLSKFKVMGCISGKHICVRLVLGMFFVLTSIAVSAQRNQAQNNMNGLGIYQGAGIQNQNQIEYGTMQGAVDNDKPPVVDTTKKEAKIRKPLESYFFSDSLRARPTFSWQTNLYTNEIQERNIDTSVNGFNNDYSYLRDGVGSAYLGNLGAATIPLNYFKRPEYRNFSFIKSYDAYLMTPERVPFFNVKKPYTNLGYISAGQKKRLEENFNATHAQNISPSTGFNVDYRSFGTRGIYNNQNTRDKNLSVALSHTGKKYSVHAGYIYNMGRIRENGGILNDSDITDTVFEMPELLDVRLNDARNEFKNNAFYIVQSYGVPLKRLTEDDFSIADRSSIFFGHSLEYNRFFKKYTDTKEKSGDYYKDWFINPNYSNDSIFESLLSNKAFIQIQPWDRNGVVGLINGGIGNDMHHYYQFSMKDYLHSNKGINKNSTYIYGSIEGKVKRYFSWSANAKYNLFGYRSADLKMGADAAFTIFIKGHPVTLSGSVEQDLRTPDYWTENYFSNHFVWNNSFAKESETRISVTLSAPDYGLELGAFQSVNSDKIYFNADMMPAQHNGNVSVSGLYAKKDFRLGGLHLNHRVLLQFSSAQEIVPVPLASAYLSYFYEFWVVKDVLRLQMGIDGRYNTEYYAFGYNPATSQFYNQREKKLGAYPLLDVFVAAKWKRMRILAKMQHANEDLFGERNYFTVLHYPLNKRVFKFGISWSFYD